MKVDSFCMRWRSDGMEVLMYKIVPPRTSSVESFDAAVSTIRDQDRRDLYKAVAKQVHRRCNDYDVLAEGDSFDQAISSEFNVPGLVSSKMVDLYDDQFVRRQGTKAIRGSIRNAAPNQLCPYCGQGSVFELDHYLPKTSFAAVTVHPANLVPTCRDCNRAKLDYVPGVSAPAVLHPYFDRAMETRWLYATVQHDPGELPVVEFYVSLAFSDSALESRLNAHMDVFSLRNRFTLWASQVLSDFELLVQSTEGDLTSLEDARNHLRRTAIEGSGSRSNSWRQATSEAMAESYWYLSDYLGLS